LELHFGSPKALLTVFLMAFEKEWHSDWESRMESHSEWRSVSLKAFG